MKILSGELKGKSIEVPQGARPVSQRVKKSCFDIMFGEIEFKNVLDLYAGSGALGIEALSQGTQKVTFVDKSKRSIGSIYKNIKNLKITRYSKIYHKNGLSAVEDFSKKNIVFDLIFIDPPYYKGLLTKTLQHLESYDILARSGYLAGFCDKKNNYSKNYKKFSLILKRNYGQSTLLIYRKE